MNKFIACLLVGLISTLNIAHSAISSVNTQQAQQWTNTKGQELLTTLAEKDTNVKYAKLDKMMTEDVNLDYIGRFVIGKYAKLMNEQQKQRYHDLFYRYVLSLYKQFDLSFNTKDIEFTIQDIKPFNNYTQVNCMVDLGEMGKKLENSQIPVRFKLIENDTKKIQAIDVEISGVSLVIEYRKRFYEMIKKEDECIDWFLDKLNDTVVANEDFAKKNIRLPNIRTK